MRGLVVSWAARGAGLAIGVGLVALVAGLAASSINVLLLTFIAVLLAAALEPFVGWMRAHTPIPRGPVILLVYLAFFALVVLFALFVLPAAFTQAEQVMRQLPSFLDEVDAWAATLRSDALEQVITSLTRMARGYLDVETPATQDVVRIGLTLAEAITSLGALLAIVFFWLVGHARTSACPTPVDQSRRAPRATIGGDYLRSCRTRPVLLRAWSISGASCSP